MKLSYKFNMKFTEESIIEKINSTHGWIDANDLADYFGVSTRTIRNYIKNIKQVNPSLIYSSNKGYMINKRAYENREKNEEIDNANLNRVNYVINQLIVSKDPIDMFDLADNLAISDTYFSRVLTMTKEHLKPFDLTIDKKRNKIWITGQEKNIRRLISKLLLTQDDNFICFNNPFSSLKSQDIDSLRKDLVFILESFQYYANDYGLNTILLHIVIMIDRVKSSRIMNEMQQRRRFYAKELQMIKEITHYLESNYNIEITSSDAYSLGVVIINNCAHTGDTSFSKGNINLYLEDNYQELAEEVLSNVAQHYGLEPFSESFIVTFSIHIMNLVNRAKDNNYTHNPLKNAFQGNYPLIYDMATYITKWLRDKLNIHINDDEISFIAFHIGAYLENTNINKEKVNCCFVYAQYHNFHVKAIEKILHKLENEIFISSNISVTELDMIPSDVELVITPCPISKKQISLPVIATSMFISNTDINNIYNCACKIMQERTKKKIINSLQYFIQSNLFHKELYTETKEEMIHLLANECIKLNLVEPSYENEVLDRESLSSTSYSNGVATPHSLNMSAKRSFLSVVINDKPTLWGKRNVNIIMMIGTSIVDREAFKLLFDELIAILYDEENVRKIIKCNTYEEFTYTLSNMIQNSGE